jgi:hypothetical protein
MAYCTACGEPRVPRQRFCIRCGAEFSADLVNPERDSSDAAPVSTDGAGHGTRWFLGLTAVLAVVVLGVTSGVAVTRRDAQGEPRPTATTAPEPTKSEDTVLPPPVHTETPLEPFETPPPASEEPATPTQPDSDNEVVAVEPAAASHPIAQPIVELLTQYFLAINDRDFERYRSLFVRDIRTRLKLSQLAEGYRSTYDSQARLVDVDTAADGRLIALVSFVSTQDASDGPDGQTCTTWTVRFFLEIEGSDLVIGKPPADYHARYAPC